MALRVVNWAGGAVRTLENVPSDSATAKNRIFIKESSRGGWTSPLRHHFGIHSPFRQKRRQQQLCSPCKHSLQISLTRTRLWCNSSFGLSRERPPEVSNERRRSHFLDTSFTRIFGRT